MTSLRCDRSICTPGLLLCIKIRSYVGIIIIGIFLTESNAPLFLQNNLSFFM